MKPDKFLYTDGHDVIVTNKKLIVKNTRYLLKGILDFGFAIVRPQRLPGLILTIIGALLISNAFLQLIPSSQFTVLDVPATYFTTNVQILTGAGIALVGIVCMLSLRTRYALRIATAEGNKDVVVSRQKEYVYQILTAIRKANAIRKAKLTA